MLVLYCYLSWTFGRKLSSLVSGILVFFRCCFVEFYWVRVRLMVGRFCVIMFVMLVCDIFDLMLIEYFVIGLVSMLMVDKVIIKMLIVRRGR